jgi:hypothetical protein
LAHSAVEYVADVRSAPADSDCVCADDYAATLKDPANVGLSISGTIEDGMATTSAKFKEMGSSVHLDADKVKESNRVL